MNIYVGNISREASEAEIRVLFEEFGPVDKMNLIRDNYTNMLKGFGFIEMTNDEEAEKAIKELNGHMLNGRPLTVSVAKPKTDKKDGGRRTGGGGFHRSSGGGGGNRGGGGGNRGGGGGNRSGGNSYNSGY